MLSVTRFCRQLPICSPVKFKNGTNVLIRQLSVHPINDSFYLCTNKPRKFDFDKKSLKITQAKENTKPLIFMISWFYGSESHVSKYCKLYTDNNFDVLVARISLIQVLFQIKEFDKLAQDVVDILHVNEGDYKEIFIHSFSAGGLLWGVSQKMIRKNMEKYGNLPNRILGQVWDSVTPPTGTVIALPIALSPNNVFLQKIIKSLMQAYIKIYYPIRDHYESGRQNFYDNLAKTPILLFASKADRIAPLEFSNELSEILRANKTDVTLQVFEESDHVSHYKMYPDIYLKSLHQHWERVKLLEKK